jgi:hypothetical protein
MILIQCAYNCESPALQGVNVLQPPDLTTRPIETVNRYREFDPYIDNKPTVVFPELLIVMFALRSRYNVQLRGELIIHWLESPEFIKEGGAVLDLNHWCPIVELGA